MIISDILFSGCNFKAELNFMEILKTFNSQKIIIDLHRFYKNLKSQRFSYASEYVYFTSSNLE
jgi:hypothetical protein